MCLIVFAYRYKPGYRLIVAANRDEFYERPTAGAAFWGDAPGILAGRDLKEWGTWMGVTRTGRFAALTNYRDPAKMNMGRCSRGGLVGGFLRSNETPERYLEDVKLRDEDYNGFNLLAGDLESLWYYSNQTGKAAQIKPGLYGLSNHLLDTPWPKVKLAKERLAKYLDGTSRVTPELLLEILADKTIPPDDSLPETGVGLERERLLAPIYIEGSDYGTRASTVIMVSDNGEISFTERAGKEEVRFDFFIQTANGRKP